MIDVSILIGSMAIIIFVYRFVYLLIPMCLSGIKVMNYTEIFNSFTLLV